MTFVQIWLQSSEALNLVFHWLGPKSVVLLPPQEGYRLKGNEQCVLPRVQGPQKQPTNASFKVGVHLCVSLETLCQSLGKARLCGSVIRSVLFYKAVSSVPLMRIPLKEVGLAG